MTAFNRVADVRSMIDEMLDPQNAGTAAFVANVDPDQHRRHRPLRRRLHHFRGGERLRERPRVVRRRRTDRSNHPDLSGDRRRPTTARRHHHDDRPGASRSMRRRRRRVRAVDRRGTRGGAQPTLDQRRATRLDHRAGHDPVGADDTATPVEPNVTRAWEFPGSDPLYRVELVAGQHQSFTDACEYLELLPTWPEDLQTLARPLVSQGGAGCVRASWTSIGRSTSPTPSRSRSSIRSSAAPR